jgi:hypothetical protein
VAFQVRSLIRTSIGPLNFNPNTSDEIEQPLAGHLLNLGAEPEPVEDIAPAEFLQHATKWVLVTAVTSRMAVRGLGSERI